MDESKSKEFRKKVLDRIASDPEFRRQLVDDPQAAMEHAGFLWGDSDSDVSGYAFGGGMGFGAFGGGTDDSIGPVPPVPNPDPVPDPIVYNDPKTVDPAPVPRPGDP